MSKGGKAHIETADGANCLHLAAATAQKDICRMLCASGLHINAIAVRMPSIDGIPDTVSGTALDVAYACNAPAAAHVLYLAGARSAACVRGLAATTVQVAWRLRKKIKQQYTSLNNNHDTLTAVLR